MTEREGRETAAPIPRLQYFQRYWVLLLLSIMIFITTTVFLVQYVRHRNVCQLFASEYTKLLDQQQESIQQVQSNREQVRQFEMELEALVAQSQSQPHDSTVDIKIKEASAELQHLNDLINNRFDVLRKGVDKSMSWWNTLHDECGLQARKPEIRLSELIVTPAYANSGVLKYSGEDIKAVITLGIFMCLGIYYLCSLAGVFLVSMRKYAPLR